MAGLSISQAWDETRGALSRNGQLLVSVALALIVLPTTILGLVAPPLALSGEEPPGWVRLVTVVVLLFGIAGQLAMIRLALTPPTVVKDAIAHGFRRLLSAFVAILLFGFVLAIVMMPLLFLIAGPEALQAAAAGSVSPEIGRAMLVVIVLVLLVSARFQLAMPVAAAEPIGPIKILKRTWTISKGHYWRLLAFIVLTLFLAVIVVLYLGEVLGGVIVSSIFGTIDPLSIGALAAGLINGIAQAAFSIVISVMLARIYAQLAGASASEASVPTSGT